MPFNPAGQPSVDPAPEIGDSSLSARESILAKLQTAFYRVACSAEGLLPAKSLESFATLPEGIGPTQSDLNRVIQLKAFDLVRMCEEMLDQKLASAPLPNLTPEVKLAFAKDYLLEY